MLLLTYLCRDQCLESNFSIFFSLIKAVTCDNRSESSFKSLYFMLFYKVKIDRAIKGNGNAVTVQ